MKILIIGSGGREHTLAWKVAQSLRVQTIYVAPGNAGTAMEPKTYNISINTEDIHNLVTFAKYEKIDLTIVGPEAPLVAGIVDTFTKSGLRCLGPSQSAAQIEGSKIFAKEFLSRHKIPTATYQTFDNLQVAEDYIRTQNMPIVIKADGLAAGKGVIVAYDIEQAITAAQYIMDSKSLGLAGKQIIVEEYLQGDEASFIALVDGKHILPLATSQDHKRRDDGDLGPNTGGMGAYSPTPVITDILYQKILNEIMIPTVHGLANDGYPYIGFLYAGIMIGINGIPRVLEFNCRSGDPETQPIMMRLQSDIIDLFDATLDGGLDGITADWDSRTAIGVVLASEGYPGSYPTGETITGLNYNLIDTQVFHAGTKYVNDHIVTTGGRVLCVCGINKDIQVARDLTYDRIKKIHWPHLYYRKDIGYKAITKCKVEPT